MPKVKRDCRIAERGIKRIQKSLHTGLLAIRPSK